MLERYIWQSVQWKKKKKSLLDFFFLFAFSIFLFSNYEKNFLYLFFFYVKFPFGCFSVAVFNMVSRLN